MRGEPMFRVIRTLGHAGGWALRNLRARPFFSILAASAASHLVVLAIMRGALLFPVFQGASPVLPAAFVSEAGVPVVETEPEDAVYFRVPVPAGPAFPAAAEPTPLAGTGRGAEAVTSPAPPPGTARDGTDRPLPPHWQEALEAGRGGGPVFFGKPFTGRTVVFVVDVSGSMLEKSGKLTRLREAFDGVMRALGGLDSSQQFNILLYADRIDLFRPAPVAAERSVVLDAFRYLESDVDCGGSTNLQEALRHALGMDPDAVLLLSDGEANTDDAAILAEVRYLREKRGRPARIDAVGFYLKAGSRPALLLEQLARETGGVYAAWKPSGPRQP